MKSLNNHKPKRSKPNSDKGKLCLKLHTFISFYFSKWCHFNRQDITAVEGTIPTWKGSALSLQTEVTDPGRGARQLARWVSGMVHSKGRSATGGGQEDREGAKRARRWGAGPTLRRRAEEDSGEGDITLTIMVKASRHSRHRDSQSQGQEWGPAFAWG